ncbi:MAG: hypothetical protein O2856_10860 [Planctomycetota bacterium]|nr:hypothetical protein [Planctomycetota bacterium]
MLARYDTSKSWQWNLDNSPEAFTLDDQPRNARIIGDWSWCGIPVNSPLGIPAGPLLDGRWLLYYASLGFDILVYKTVRSCARECYGLPNLVPVETMPLTDAGMVLKESKSMRGSWAVSFGMPSQSPDIWRRDIELTRQRIPEGKVLVVSVVGTQDTSITDPQASLELLADDFARCAKWAANSGAHGIEANFSCPNVSTTDGQLFQQATAAAFVAERIRLAIGSTPLVIKIGRMANRADAESLILALGPFINGLAMTNSIAARVQRNDQSLLFDGQLRGICGDATRTASVEQVRVFSDVLAGQNLPLQLIGVGGISTADHVRNYLAAGASSVALATSAMVDPLVGVQIRETL